MSIAVNQTGSKWEAYVDHFMKGVEDKISDFENYTQSPSGKLYITYLDSISKYASAIILGIASPVTVTTFAVVGTVIRSFSAEQVENVLDKAKRISDTLPTSVKALAVVIAMTYARILFPIVAGLYLGLEIGSRISPHTLNKMADQAADLVGQQNNDDQQHTVVTTPEEEEALKRAYFEELDRRTTSLNN